MRIATAMCGHAVRMRPMAVSSAAVREASCCHRDQAGSAENEGKRIGVHGTHQIYRTALHTGGAQHLRMWNPILVKVVPGRDKAKTSVEIEQVTLCCDTNRRSRVQLQSTTNPFAQ